MQTQDISQLPVFEDEQSVGAIYEDQILNLALQGKDLRKLVMREVMGAADAASVLRSAGRARHLYTEPRQPAVFVEDGQRQARSPHQVRPDGYRRRLGREKALNAFDAGGPSTWVSEPAVAPAESLFFS